MRARVREKGRERKERERAIERKSEIPRDVCDVAVAEHPLARVASCFLSRKILPAMDSTDRWLCYLAGMIGALPPGAMHPAFPMGFPAPMLAPMMHPRFR